MSLLNWIAIVSWLLLPIEYIMAQSQDSHEHFPQQNEGYFEVIGSIINSHSLEENEGTIGNELHITYWVNRQLGAGVSLTTKLHEEDLWYDTAVIGSWSPVKWVTTNLGPNFSWEAKGRDFAVSAYFEVEINIFIIDQIHIGPVLGTLAGEESELTHGFHLGFEF